MSIAMVIERSSDVPALNARKAAIAADLLVAMREIVRRAIMTLASLRDPDARFRGYSRLPVNMVHDVQQAYGYSSAWVRAFRPTPYEIDQMMIVLPWVAWVRRQEGDQAARRILAWAMGSPLWRIGQRENCSDRTILNRIDRSVANIIHEFAGADIPVEHIDEPYHGTEYALVTERSPGPHGEGRILKVYVGGIGFVRGGKRLRTAQEMAPAKIST